MGFGGSNQVKTGFGGGTQSNLFMNNQNKQGSNLFSGSSMMGKTGMMSGSANPMALRGNTLNSGGMFGNNKTATTGGGVFGGGANTSKCLGYSSYFRYNLYWAILGNWIKKLIN
jgi:hypothetical protein